MKKAQVIIGANFGDEGKGLVTDYLSSFTGPETLVVRFNGGAQAGHTVVTPDGRRHVFGHIGSGTFMGCPTFLSQFFVCNPLTFLKETDTLRQLGVMPIVHIDPRARITTPYDMMINQYSEEMRGLARHGSCGLGFGETIERNLHQNFTLTYADLADDNCTRTRIQSIRDHWVPKRLKALNFTCINQQWNTFFHSDQLLENFLKDIQYFLIQTRRAHHRLLPQSQYIIFEGAQGLLLDQSYGCFPHVTRSHTGLRNVMSIAQQANITDMNIHYLTRSYLTRHGAGPMPNEHKHPIYSRIHDSTNIPNAYQGALRFGLLDIDLLNRTILHDLHYVSSSIHCSYDISVSCMDQIDGHAVFIAGGKIKKTSPQTFLAHIQDTTNVHNLLISHGPTRGDVSAWGRQRMGGNKEVVAA